MCAPALADDDGLTPKIIYAPGQTVSDNVGCVKNSALPNGYKAVPFSTYLQNGDATGHGAGDNCASHWTLQNDGTLLYSYTPTPKPDVRGWETDIWTDNNLPIGVKLNLAIFFPLVESNISNPVFIQQGWAGLKAANASSWLPSQVSGIIESYAGIRNIPLLP